MQSARPSAENSHIAFIKSGDPLTTGAGREKQMTHKRGRPRKNKPRYETLNKWVEIARVDGVTYIMIDGKELTHIDTEHEEVITTFLGVKQ